MRGGKTPKYFTGTTPLTISYLSITAELFHFHRQNVYDIENFKCYSKSYFTSISTECSTASEN